MGRPVGGPKYFNRWRKAAMGGDLKVKWGCFKGNTRGKTVKIFGGN